MQLDEVARAMHVLCMDKMSKWRLHRYLESKNIEIYLISSCVFL